jgi:hypothetical protein
MNRYCSAKEKKNNRITQNYRTHLSFTIISKVIDRFFPTKSKSKSHVKFEVIAFIENLFIFIATVFDSEG